MTDKKHMLVIPDDFSDLDLIGYNEHGQGLVEMIRSVRARGSFTIGVFGQWGQGKTSMLRQIEREVAGGKSADEKNILTVWFNPWQFMGEEHMIVPFFHTLASYLKEFKEQLDSQGKTLSTKTGNFLKALAHVPVALSYGIEAEIKLPLFLKAKFNVRNILKEVRDKKKELDDQPHKEFKEMVDEYESMYYSLISRLRKASTGMDLKIVVFIDDLDRCLPEKAVELLEGMKILLDLPGFVFVIGVAREVIEQGIRVRYHELFGENGMKMPFLEQDYLDKIIQFPMTLPPPDLTRLKGMIAGYLDDLQEVKPYLDTIQEAIGTNPRSLKRFVNNLSYTFWVTDKKESFGGNPFLPELLIKMTLIAFKFPGFYRLIGKNPDHLLRVQELISKEVQKATGFLEIDELDLFSPRNRESISQILAKQQRQAAETDQGFTDEKEVRRYVSLLSVTNTSPETEVQDNTSLLWQTIESRMLAVNGGTVEMTDLESGTHLTAAIKPFRLDKFPVTQDIYNKIMGKEKNHSRFSGGDRPVENISWFDAVEFCNLLSKRMDLKPVYSIDAEEVTTDTGAGGFRLPSEAEWQYACQAGTNGEQYADVEQIAWHRANADGSSHGVGKKEANPWGFYDMLGNVWEWCWDHPGPFPGDTQEPWTGPQKGTERIFRGGSWNNSAASCKASKRLYIQPNFHDHDMGFRLAMSL